MGSHLISGRSDVIAKNGMVATSQPLATWAGLKMLANGGNAVDAAIAAATVLDVVEPYSTGCGGDAFALVHLEDESSPRSFNGSGRSGSLASLDQLLGKGWDEIPTLGGASVTVPGAVHLWCHLVKKFGNLELDEILKPAIDYALSGFPVTPIISEGWKSLVSRFQNDEAHRVFSINGRGPEIGETMKNPDLGQVFELIAAEGHEAFYTGTIAKAIVETVQEHGGFLTTEDLEKHETLETQPIRTEYRGVEVYEPPPNGQGFAALEMLRIMEEFDFNEFPSVHPDRFHIMIEAKKLAYADLYQHNADPKFYSVPLETLLSSEYGRMRAQLIDMKKSMSLPSTGLRLGSDTVYLATADKEGNAVSFINSLYTGFGSGLVVPGTGIKLQSRGNLFSLNSDHPNCYAPNKLPFHTIIPGALYKKREFLGVFGIMGGAHQAQAHAQFVSNLLDYGMSPQWAMDHPRFHHNHEDDGVALEPGLPATTSDSLKKRGHKIVERPEHTFGGGQVILRLRDSWIAGSDHRKDGMAAGF